MKILKILHKIDILINMILHLAKFEMQIFMNKFYAGAKVN